MLTSLKNHLLLLGGEDVSDQAGHFTAVTSLKNQLASLLAEL